MSRSGYSDGYDDVLEYGRWRAQVNSAIRGNRGQIFLKDLLTALDEMPNKRLIANELRKDGEVCALGALGAKRGMDLENMDPEDYKRVGTDFNIAHQLAQEIVYENDECGAYKEIPEERWTRIREWVSGQIKNETSGKR